MSERKVLRAQASLSGQIDSISEAMKLGESYLDPQTVDFAALVISRAEARRQLSSDHVVIGLFGATGSGKSSLFNELAEHSSPGPESFVRLQRKPSRRSGTRKVPENCLIGWKLMIGTSSTRCSEPPQRRAERPRAEA